MRFLAMDGRWVAKREDARDFHSLLPAYQHARDHTARRFQVLLYSPDDEFSATIIAGQGIAHKKIQIPVAEVPEAHVCIEIKTTSSRFNNAFLRAGHEDVRHNLN